MVSYSIGNGSAKRRRWPKVLFGLVVFIVVVLIAAVVTVRHVYNTNLQPVSSSQRPVSITIRTGATAHEIAQQLQSSGVIRAAWAFEWFVRNNDVRDKLQAGSYDLRPNQSVSDIVKAITLGKIATNLVTILPAQRLDQIRQALVANGFKVADVDAALSPDMYKDHPALVDKPEAADLEGYLYPDSYEKTATTKPETVIRQSLDQMEKYLTPDFRQAVAAQHLSTYDAIILASIVEKEVSNPAERKVVAQVFLKRLQQGMPLGSDVTVIYGSLKAGKGSDLSFDSAYNTHLHAGLPPGPISNVSEVSLTAVAHPATTDYLYFVSGDDGVTHFSKTLDEHNAAVKQYCKKLCQ